MRPSVRPLAIRPVAPAGHSGVEDRSIGAILIDDGRLRAGDAERIVEAQKEQGVRFGEAGVKLGLLKDEDIQFALARQFDYPYLVPGESSVSQELVAAYQPFSRQVEALRALRSQLMLRWFNGEPERRALAITSPGRGEGRSYLAANLAVVFSQLGERTLLIDADMRHPKQHTLFDLANRVGLSALLSGRGDLTAVERVPALADFLVLSAGATPPNPQELLSRAAFARLIHESSRCYDVVIVDTPAAEVGADAQTISMRTGAALMVARKDCTRIRDLQGLSADLHSATTAVVGTVLNAF